MDTVAGNWQSRHLFVSNLNVPMAARSPKSQTGHLLSVLTYTVLPGSGILARLPMRAHQPRGHAPPMSLPPRTLHNHSLPVQLPIWAQVVYGSLHLKCTKGLPPDPHPCGGGSQPFSAGGYPPRRRWPFGQGVTPPAGGSFALPSPPPRASGVEDLGLGELYLAQRR